MKSILPRLIAVTLFLGWFPPGLLSAPIRPEAPEEASDELPRGALTRLGSTRLRAGGQLGGLVFSPDGKTLAACATDGAVRLWDVKTGKQVRVLRAHKWTAHSLAFTADGKRLAVGSWEFGVGIYDTANGKEVAHVKSGWVYSLAFSPDGKSLAVGGNSGSATLWDVSSPPANGQIEKAVHTFSGHNKAAVWALAWSPDGKTLVTAGLDGKAVLWDAAAGKEIGPLEVAPNNYSALCFTPDGKTLLTAGQDGRVRFWDPGTRTCNSEIPVGNSGFTSMGLSSDGKTLATGSASEHAVRLWDLSDANGKLLRVIKGLHEPAQHLSLSRDGLVVATGGFAGARVQLFSTDSGKELHALEGHRSVVTELSLSADGKTVVTAGSDHTVRVWDLAGSRQRHVFAPAGNQLARGAISPDGKLVAVGTTEGTLCIYDAAKGELLHDFGPRQGVSALAFAPDGKTLAVAESTATGRVIRLIDPGTGREVAELKGHADAIYTVCFSPDGKKLASGGQDRVLRVWDVSGKELWNVAVVRTISQVAFSPASDAVTCDGTSQARVWEADGGKERFGVAAHKGTVRAVAFSSDGRLLATSGLDKTLAIWDAKTGKALGEPWSHTDLCAALAFTPDSKRLLSASFDATVIVWDLTTKAGLAGGAKDAARVPDKPGGK